MSNIEKFSEDASNKKIYVQLALLAQSNDFTHKTLERIERKIDALDKKIDRTEVKIYSNLKWIVGMSIPTILTISGVIIEIYQYVKS